MRRVLVVIVAAGLLGACSSSNTPPLVRYYDPNGLFSARLPSANDVVVIPRQSVSSTLTLLSGVLAIPPTASPSPSSAIGGGFLQPTSQQDVADYTVSAVKAGKVASVSDLATTLLQQTVNAQPTLERRVIVDGLQGLLVVADHQDSSGGYTDASAFFLFGGIGYWVRELFPLGEWDQRRDVFRQLMQSFQLGVPAGLPAVPLTRPGLQIQSKLAWPLG